MKKKKKHPRVSFINTLDSNVHYCRGGALIRLTDGLGSLRCVENVYESYKLYLGANELLHAHIPTCGTCGDMLYTGYGAENISLDDCFAARERINAGFINLADSVEAISPVIGLLPDGDYVIADFQLFPVIGGEHFWNGQYREKSLLHHCYSWMGDELYDAPAYLFPTERAAFFNRKCVEKYIDRLEEGLHFPRAIAYYIDGCMALLLDGHHKAAAAAATGKMVRCLVIMHAEVDEKRYKKLFSEKERLFLTHNKHVTYFENGSGWSSMGADSLLLCDKNGVIAGHICNLSDRAELTEEGETWPSRKELTEEWGRIPEEYCRNLNKYPCHRDFFLGTMIPPNKIKEEFSALIREKDTKRNTARAQYLAAYCKCFPENKWITQNQREWIEKIKERQQLV